MIKANSALHVRDLKVYIVALDYFVLQPVTSHSLGRGVILHEVMGSYHCFMGHYVHISGVLEGLTWLTWMVMPLGLLPTL